MILYEQHMLWPHVARANSRCHHTVHTLGLSTAHCTHDLGYRLAITSHKTRGSINTVPPPAPRHKMPPGASRTMHVSPGSALYPQIVCHQMSKVCRSKHTGPSLKSVRFIAALHKLQYPKLNDRDLTTYR